MKEAEFVGWRGDRNCVVMSDLNNHAYHYKNSIFNRLSELHDEDEDDDKDDKKRPRRRKRMLTGVSKQRRAANERERKRLQIINMAYKELKGNLPLFPNEVNIPKIEIVRLATRTIRYLSDILNNSNNDYDHRMVDSQSDSSSTSYSYMSENSSEGSMNNMGELPPDMKLEPLDSDLDVSNLLFQDDDILLDFDEAPPTMCPQPDGFSGLDISSFIGGS